MANPFFFGSPRGAGFEFLSDVAAAERQVDAYFAQLHAQPTVPPEGAAAFALTSEQAVEAYTRWLNSLSFVPGGLKRFADLGALKAVYVPFWVVNAMTHTTYQGQRGVNHLETEHYQDAQGNAQTRQVTRTQWSPAIGEVTHYFENVLISGKDALPPGHVTLLTPPDLIQKMEVYAPDRHTHPIEPYTIDPRTAFTRARTEMEAKIRMLVGANIGGDRQQVDGSQTRYVGVSVRHVLVPCFQGAYKYRDKSYDVLINGFNGEVTGAHPVSAGKIALLVLGVVAAVAIIVALFWFFVIAPAMK